MECTRLVAAVVAAVTVLGAVAVGGAPGTGAAAPDPAPGGASAIVLASGPFPPDLPGDFQASNRAW